jgi:uncharacterized protein (DUF2267 family)
MNTSLFYRTVMRASGIEDRFAARRGTAAVFHALRDRLTPQEADHVLAQLPRPLKDVWSEGDRLERRPARMNRAAFYARVREEADLATDRDARWMTRGVFAALREQLTPGESEDVAAQLPRQLEDVWSEAVAA